MNQTDPLLRLKISHSETFFTELTKKRVRLTRLGQLVLANAALLNGKMFFFCPNTSLSSNNIIPRDTLFEDTIACFEIDEFKKNHKNI